MREDAGKRKDGRANPRNVPQNIQKNKEDEEQKHIPSNDAAATHRIQLTIDTDALTPCVLSSS